jgi:hypothetical protein
MRAVESKPPHVIGLTRIRHVANGTIALTSRGVREATMDFDVDVVVSATVIRMAGRHGGIAAQRSESIAHNEPRQSRARAPLEAIWFGLPGTVTPGRLVDDQVMQPRYDLG